MPERFITPGLLMLAILFYVTGMLAPAVFLLVLGGMVEIAFWVRLASRRRRSSRR